MTYKYVVLDTETGAEEFLGRKGSFWVNPVIALGLKPYDQDASAHYYNFTPTDSDIIPFIAPYNVLVAFNAKFDLLHLWKHESLQEWLKDQNNKIYDPQYVEYILSGQNYTYPSLRDTAVNRYGLAERTKWIEYYLFDKKETLQCLESELSTFGNNMAAEEVTQAQALYQTIMHCQQMQDIPTDKVLEDVQNDVLDTEAIMLKQLEKVKEEGMESLVEVLMDCLLATTEMEYNGVYIDKEILEKNRQDRQNELDLVESNLNDIIMEYWK
jgi:DNA polymerase I-like protein with 3'-5' exonuclease and polymerase domains